MVAAIQLAQLGWRVAVLERHAAPYPLPRAVGMDHEIARILQNCGVADPLRALIAPVTRYEWCDAAGQELIMFPGLDQIEISGWPKGASFSQPELERVLDERLRSLGGQVRVFRGWEATVVHQSEGRVEVIARAFAEDGRHDHLSIQARFLVGCDGAGSFVRQSINSEYRDLGFSEDWVVCDFWPRDPSEWDSSMVQICDPERPTTLMCGGPGRRRVEWMLRAGERRQDFNELESVWPLLAPLGWTPDNARLERVATYHFRGCVAKKWVEGSVAIAGDAAHLTPPFAGQGLCAALRDAQALVWRLNLILSGRAGAGLLQSYETERSEHVTRFIRFAIDLGKVICVSDPAQAAARDAALRSKDTIKPASYPAYEIGPSPMLAGHTPHAGSLALQTRVLAGGTIRLLDDVTGPGFVLLAWQHDPKASLSKAWLDFCEACRITIVVLNKEGGLGDVTGAYQRWFAALGTDTVLIRPDFYILGTGNPVELLEALKTALQQESDHPARDNRLSNRGIRSRSSNYG